MNQRYKLQWIDNNGFHQLISNDYDALLVATHCIQLANIASIKEIELWDMYDIPTRVM
jgi:hypothetical protein